MATEDILINDGDGFVSLSELAAEQVDVALPISSTDGTVTLDSPSADTFTISTGGKTGLVVDSQQRVGINCDPSFRLHAKDGTAGSEFLYSGTYAYVRRLPSDSTVGFSNRNKSNTWTLGIEDGVADSAAWEIWSDSHGTAGEHRFSFKKNGDFVVETAGASVQTPRIAGPADNDASIALGASATISTGGQTRAVFRDGLGRYPATASELNNSNVFTIESTISGTEAEPGYCGMSFVGRYTSGVSGCIGVKQYYQAGTDTTAKRGAFVFGFRNPGGDTLAPVDVLTIDTETADFSVDIQTSRLTGPVANDASIELGPELLTTNHTPTQPNSIATKQTVDDKIQVMTTAEYNALATKNPTTLYCLTD